MKPTKITAPTRTSQVVDPVYTTIPFSEAGVGAAQFAYTDTRAKFTIADTVRNGVSLGDKWGWDLSTSTISKDDYMHSGPAGCAGASSAGNPPCASATSRFDVDVEFSLVAFPGSIIKF